MLSNPEVIKRLLDVITGMLQLFSFDVYALLDPVSRLPFVTPFVSMKFKILPDILDGLFLVLPRLVISWCLKESIKVFLLPCPIYLY